ncbi:protein spaetzle-like isoform X2 [Centruroides sculpturatus]|uniref:protein spaetzle-like isoform X1 n=2 Tax=Centruroides sculpturatus TaxID=218467 RepID=UPI000C6E37F9|nr:protein spaetzle-like isoform X1 [Centruroides sculpturatus]XP_023224284.1 protein spaetzle-like isoform X2 [Centruroides sculpturatus]
MLFIVLLLHCNANIMVTLLYTGSVTSRPNPDLPIVFPDDEIQNRSKVYRPEINARPSRPHQPEIDREYPPKGHVPRYPFEPGVYKERPLCSNPSSSFCENVSNYPTSEIRQSIPFSKDQFREIFGPPELHSRVKATNVDVSEERICSRKTRLFYPKAGKSDDNKWVYVVNDVDYVQAVFAEICENENKSCLYMDENLPAGFDSKCRQLYAYKRLLALDPDDKKSQIASFRFPSCCVCYIKYPIGWTDILNRKKNSDVGDSFRT